MDILVSLIGLVVCDVERLIIARTTWISIGERSTMWGGWVMDGDELRPFTRERMGSAGWLAMG
jgi:hypothetical protein